MSEKKRVIDVACGSKMFWFDKKNPDVEYCDKRTVEYHEFYPKRYIEISRPCIESSAGASMST